jgi:hypothetical protein
MGQRSQLAVLEAVSTATSQEMEIASFCSHCGARSEISDVAASTRVCQECNLGLVLESSADAAPKPGGAFIVIDDSMAVCAVSRAAEDLLATSEIDAVNRHVTELLVPADAEAQGPSNLAVAVTWAARGEGSVQKVVVRPAKTFGVRMTTRIASCGPRQAALLVFE